MEEGIPCLYYGTEQDFAGGNDPANREVLWDTGFSTTGDTFVHFRKLARIRADYAALRLGDTNIVWSTTHVGKEEDAGIFAFERAGGDAGAAYALVVMNTSNTKSSVTAEGTNTMIAANAKGKTLVDVLDPARPSFKVGASGELRLTVPRQSSMILVPQSDVK
jgi:glycosidase